MSLVGMAVWLPHGCLATAWLFGSRRAVWLTQGCCLVVGLLSFLPETMRSAFFKALAGLPLKASMAQGALQDAVAVADPW